MLSEVKKSGRVTVCVDVIRMGRCTWTFGRTSVGLRPVSGLITSPDLSNYESLTSPLEINETSRLSELNLLMMYSSRVIKMNYPLSCAIVLRRRCSVDRDDDAVPELLDTQGQRPLEPNTVQGQRR